KNQQNKYEYSDSTICTVLREDIDKESYPFLNHLLKIDTNSYFNNNNNINSLIEILKGIGNNAYIRDTVIKKAKEWSNLNYYKVDILESIVETLNKYPQIIGFFQKYNFKGCYEHLSDIDLILNGEKKEGKESYPLTEEQTAFFAELLKYNPNIYDSGLKIHNAIKNFKPENYQKAIKYTKFFKFEKLNELLNNIDKNTISDLMIFLIDDSYDKEIEKHSAGKYQKELIKILNIDNLTNCNNNMDKIYKYPSPLELLCKSRLSKEDFLNGIRKLSRYTFKLLYEKPNQYLSGIDIKYSTPIDNKFPELPTYELNREREKIIKFLCNNLPEILTAFKYVDADTINHMLDRRTDLFEVQIKQLNELTEDNFEILSKALVCKSVTNNKPLSPKEKIQLCQIVEIFQRAKIDMSPIIKATESGKIDLNSIKLIIQHKILKKAGINPNNHMLKNKKLFNEEYSYLALIDKSSEILRNIDNLFEEKFKITINQIRGNIVRKENIIKCYEDILNNLQLLGNISDNAIMILNELVHMLKNIDKYSDKEILQKMYESIELSINANAERNNLYTCIRESIIGDFKEFITNPSNKYGQANMRTKQAFEKEGLNYDKWLSPEITDLQFEVAGKKMTIKMWDRNPQEDLFIGNKTTCCTAIGTGGNSAATPLYLLNTAYNVVELYDSKDNVVGMSRVFMGKMEDKPVLLMDNIELNKTFIKNMNTEQLQEIRDNFFSYMNQYAQQITGNSETEVYFYSRDLRVPVNDLKQTNRTTHFIGSLSQEEIYVNAARCRWINPTRLNEIGEIPWLKVPNVN
ncbi:hypothetical protein IJG14_06880, partial [bacterium]|nr:hypothetical protein [bacterium]